MHILYETPLGYALFRSSPLEVEEVKVFASSKDAVEEIEQIAEGKVPRSVMELVQGRKLESVGVGNAKLAQALEEALQKENVSLKVKTGEEVDELVRSIHQRLVELLDISEKELTRAALLLSHALSREKLKMTAGKLDVILVQSVKVLDKLDKDINNKCMRIREWYGMYFPELGEILPENKQYLSVLKQYLNHEAIEEGLREEIEEAKGRTIGCEIEGEDESILKESVESALQMYGTRESLQEHLYKRMKQVAPNLLELTGEYLGARLIAHAGSLAELAKKPSSTVQVMGAEKSLFQALKEKKNTPKYGHIYNSSYVGQAPQEIKGKIARTFAAKIALASRCDMYGEDESGEFGKEARQAIEKKIDVLSQQNKRKKKSDPYRKEKFAVKRPGTSSDSFKRQRGAW
ncbi:nucleolar protein 58 [Nematocida sp. AWRm77]|nr:nucleolar protein 58 [Nematocida sp. AWRm77]